MGRAARTVVVLTLLIGASVATAPSALAAPNATAAVDVSETLAGTQETYAFTVTNTSNTSEAPINHVSIKTSKGAIVIDDVAAEGWTATISSSTAIFRLGSLAPGATQQFFVLATASPRADDEMENWTVKVSNQDGINAYSPPDPQTQIRVLSVDSVDVVAPEGVLDYSGTKGQTITIESTISNYSTVALNVDGKLTTTSGDSKTELEDKISTPPGSSADFHFSVVLGDPGTRAFLGGANDPTGNVAMTTESDDFEVAPKPAFTYRAGSLSPTASVSGASQTFSVSLLKADSPGVSFDATQSYIKIESGPDKAFTAPLASPTYAEPGAQDLGLTFAPVMIPNFTASSYNVWVKLVGEDDNGQAFSLELERIATFTKEDAMPYATPTIEAPEDQVDPDGMPVVKNGDTITLGGDIKTTAASGAPLDPTAQILDCDLAVLDPNLVRVSTIDVPLGQCQNVGGHFSGQMSPASIGVTDGFLRLEAQAKKAVGGAPSPPDQVSNLIAVDNVAPTVSAAYLGCGTEPVTCEEFRTLRLQISEPVNGSFLPLDFSVAGHLVSVTDLDCIIGPSCQQVVLTLLEQLTEGEQPNVSYDFQDAPLRERPHDGAGHEIADSSEQAAEQDAETAPLPAEEARDTSKDLATETSVLQRTPPGEIVVLSVNALQAGTNARKDNPCPLSKSDPGSADYGKHKACWSDQREAALAERIRTLGLKPSGDPTNDDPFDDDGMGGVAPDILLLQEVSCEDLMDLKDPLNDGNKKHLRAHLAATIEIDVTPPGPTETVVKEDADYRVGRCARRNAYSRKNEEVRVPNERTADPNDHFTEKAYMVADTAILYLNQTMAPLSQDAGGSTESVVSYHAPEDRDAVCNRTKNADSKKPISETTEFAQCKIEYKRNYIMGFEERIPVGESTCEACTSIGTATAHLPDPKGLRTAAQAQRTTEWVTEIADRLMERYEDADYIFIGGDLNIKRCHYAPLLNKPLEPTDCEHEAGDGSVREWWQTITTSRRVGFRFIRYEMRDAVFEVHSPGREELDFQYFDGCALLQSGSCRDFATRELRIDFLFAKGFNRAIDIPLASHDLTCGIGAIGRNLQADDHNCDFLLNLERYSDHRLVWSLLTQGD